MEHRSALIGSLPGGRLALGQLTGEIIGAFFEVYNTLRFGHLESTYGGALAVELEIRGLRFRRECPLDVHYKERLVGHYRADFIVEGRVIVELKAMAVVGHPERRQLLNYLCATRMRIGLLLNFGPEAKFLRVING